MAIGDAIRCAREKRGWTRIQLAEKVGVDASAISRIEAGNRLPGVDLADALEDALTIWKGSLANLVIAEKRRRRDRIRQLKRILYSSPLSIEEIRRRLENADTESRDK